MLNNQKFLSDESVLKKIEQFSLQGVESNFLKDNEKIATIIPRLNRRNDTQNWLSMQPNPLRYCGMFDGHFGEVNEYN